MPGDLLIPVAWANGLATPAANQPGDASHVSGVAVLTVGTAALGASPALALAQIQGLIANEVSSAAASAPQMPQVPVGLFHTGCI
jgi:hypothetical protein